MMSRYKQSAFLPDADTIEGSHNGVGKLVLFKGALDKILDRELLKAIG